MRTSSIYQLKVNLKGFLPSARPPPPMFFALYYRCLDPESFLSIILCYDRRHLNAMSA